MIVCKDYRPLNCSHPSSDSDVRGVGREGAGGSAAPWPRPSGWLLCEEQKKKRFCLWDVPVIFYDFYSFSIKKTLNITGMSCSLLLEGGALF